MDDASHGVGKGGEERVNVVEADGSHRGDLEDFVDERSFSTVDDEAVASQLGSQFVEAHVAREADRGDGVGEWVIGVEE